MPAALEMLRQMVGINSYTTNREGVNRLGKFTACFAPWDHGGGLWVQPILEFGRSPRADTSGPARQEHRAGVTSRYRVSSGERNNISLASGRVTRVSVAHGKTSRAGRMSVLVLSA